VVILEAGTDLLSGPPDQLTKRYWPNQVVRIDAEDRDGLDRLAGQTGVLRYHRNGHAEIEVDDLARVPDLVFALTEAGLRITRVEPHLPTLEELYFAVREERRRVLAEQAPGAGPRPVASARDEPLEGP
jgi:hypothetical protein